VIAGGVLATTLVARSGAIGISGSACTAWLEVLVAADIIRTVAVSPTFRGVRVLAIIVLIRG
jgi:Protein of unknown function (DUF1622)